MNTPGRFYRLLNVLSLDVALGAVCCAAWFARGFQAQLRPYAYLALGLTVWIIYTADHLLDGSKITREASTYRHRFHQKHFKTLLVIVLLAVFVDFTLLFFIRLKILYAGLGLFLIVILYLLVNRWLSFVKEIVIALVYSCGVLLPAFSVKQTALSIPDAVWIGCFFLTTLINLILFSVYDLHSDKADGSNSFVLTFGEEFTRKILFVLFSLQAALIMTLLYNKMLNMSVVLFVMNTTLLVLFSKPSFFKQSDRYRLYGDVIFLFPVVLVFVG
ncbi:MAG: hypothetical protein E6Q96_08815 [Cyclobacteriaceae bacterium]|nr:MAG: hypothetical protein E6Q96_08815 [Cyclobacteriaceae bacterium]